MLRREGEVCLAGEMRFRKMIAHYYRLFNLFL